jgi:hypothetical protein
MRAKIILIRQNSFILLDQDLSQNESRSVLKAEKNVGCF